jgi:nucleoside-diphosphate-sugar epimerase
MQTIIGSGGTIGIPLAKELTKFTQYIRLVSRHPKKINSADELFSLDVTDHNRLDAAIDGSDVVYITIGFEYKLQVWQTLWPSFLSAVIAACEKHKARLVFFDNVYMYAKTSIPYMTEDAPLDPPSKKGAVRLQVHQMIMDAVAKNRIKALIARSADFYGPDTDKSVLIETGAKNLLKGKKAQVFGNPDKIHTYTFTPDAGKATALLGNTDDAYNQVWHVPTTKEKLTTRQWLQMIAEEIGTEPKTQKIPTWMLRVIGLFNPLIKEFPEMLYQNEMDYVFDSSKFEKRFGMSATTPKEGIKIMVDYLKKTSLNVKS